MMSVEIDMHSAPPVPLLQRSAFAQRSDFAHTPCYCEENAFRLIERLVSTWSSPYGSACSHQLWAVFISNETKSVPVWRQRAGDPTANGGLCVWDYHVVVVYMPPAAPPASGGAEAASSEGSSGATPRPAPALVLDLDTSLPFPCPLEEYAREALMTDQGCLQPQFQRWAWWQARGRLLFIS